jgi:hypothetical protein
MTPTHWLIAARGPLLAVFAVALLAASCDGTRVTPASAPLVPSAVPSPAATELISGTAYDSALRPIPGATIEIIEGPGAGMSTTASARGEFALTVPGKVEDTMKIRASKHGYVAATAPPQPYCERCNPRRWVFFYLDVLEPPVQLAGDYSLTFVADANCTNLPQELHSRTYQASVSPSRINYPSYPATSNTSYELTVKGTGFSDTFHHFFLNVAGHFVNISIGDHTDPGVAERVGANTYFTFNGSTTATVQSPGSTISASFEGWFEQCELREAIGSRYDCSAAKAIRAHRCQASNHQLILTRTN